MTTTPPEQQPPAAREPSAGRSLGRSGQNDAIPSVPVNAELVVYLAVVAVIAIIWLASDLVTAGSFVTALVVLTSAYLVSRGIAKASRVYE
jgi:hypothetical protein